MSTLGPPPPETTDLFETLGPPRLPFSVGGLALGLLLGLLGGLFYAWQIDPVILRNSAPADLDTKSRQIYILVAAREYQATQNLELVVTRLLAVAPDENPFTLAAETACNLIRAGQVDGVADVEAIRSLRAVYESQGLQAPCDISAFNTPIPVTVIVPTSTIPPTATLSPVASKTPTQAVQAPPINTPLPTNTSALDGGSVFREAFLEPFCDPRLSGILEIYVRDSNSLPLPGIALEVIDSQRNSATFFTGLKPERGDDYADFAMKAGEIYRVRVRDGGELSRELSAISCDATGTVTSYRLVIQRQRPR